MLTDMPSQSFPLEGIIPDPQQPRRTFDPAEMETLKASLAAHGLLQPIVVRRDKARQYFLIVCGERRWRCAKELGWTEISCRVINRELTPAEIVVLQLTENLQRQDLNPLDEARSLERLQNLLGCSREVLAEHALRSTASICRSFKLLELPPEVQTLIEQNRLPVSIAAELHRCSDPILVRELAEQVAAGQLTRSEVTTRVRQATPVGATKPQRLSLPLATGITLQLPSSTSLEECEAAVSKWLRRLRQAKLTMSDMTAFAESLRTAAATQHS